MFLQVTLNSAQFAYISYIEKLENSSHLSLLASGASLDCIE